MVKNELIYYATNHVKFLGLSPPSSLYLELPDTKKKTLREKLSRNLGIEEFGVETESERIVSEGVTNERGIEFSSKWFLTASLITPSGPRARSEEKKGAKGVGSCYRIPVTRYKELESW